MYKMSSSRIWLIGASTGIGAVLARRLAAEGHRVIVSARSEDKLQSLAETPGITSLPLDVTDEEGFKVAAKRLQEQLGGIDLAILNAGDYSPMPLEDFDTRLFRDTFEVNTFGVIHGLAALLPIMQNQGGGRILVTASIAGYRGLPKAAPYNASKAAVISLCESLRPELKQQGISLRVINPGFVRTPLTDKNRFPMPFLITAEQAADAIMKELDKDNFEIAFPKRFAWLMKLLRLLPYRWYFGLVGKMV